MKRIEESTKTIEEGMHNPFVWVLLIGGILGIPFTAGLSLIAVFIGLMLMTGGGKACVQAIPPVKEDIVAPGYGCIRMLGALIVLVAIVFVAFLFLAAVAYNMGVQP